MITNEQIKSIAQEAESYKGEYEYIGIRIQEQAYGAEVGQEISHCSSNWDDGEELDSKLDGVCAIDIDEAQYLPRNGGYDGSVILIIGSDTARSGEDVAEIVMENAVVIAVK